MGKFDKSLGERLHADVNDVEFSSIIDATREIPQSPRFIFGGFPKNLNDGYYKSSGLWAIGVYKINSFDLFGGYSLIKNGDFFCCPEANIHPVHVELSIQQIRNMSVSDLERKYLIGEYAMINGPGYTVYGHWLSDLLPKLFTLHTAGIDIFNTAFLFPSDIPSYGLDWLHLLGVSRDQIVLYDKASECVSVERLVIPTTFHNGVRMSRLIRDAYQFFESLIERRTRTPLPKKADKRLFISRSKAPQTRPLKNRDAIERIAIDSSLKLVHPQELSLLEQVHLFRSASVVVGEYGSALHGTLFSPPGTIVCGLRGSLPHPGFIQSGIGYVLEQPTGYVFGENDMTHTDGRFVIGEEDFSKCLDLVLADQPFEGLKY